MVTYSSDEIRKTQNEHLNIICQNLIVMNLKPISQFFGVYTTCFFYLEAGKS